MTMRMPSAARASMTAEACSLPVVDVVEVADGGDAVEQHLAEGEQRADVACPRRRGTARGGVERPSRAHSRKGQSSPIPRRSDWKRWLWAWTVPGIQPPGAAGGGARQSSTCAPVGGQPLADRDDDAVLDEDVGGTARLALDDGAAAADDEAHAADASMLRIGA
jgi:hypothetical protein